MAKKSLRSAPSKKSAAKSAGTASAFAIALAAGYPAFAQGALDPETFLPPAPQWSGASEQLIAPATDKWITPAEKANFVTTPNHADTLAWLRKLDKATDLIRLETFGTTPQGRELVAAIVSKDGAKLKPSKPVFLIQAGIHSGEIDGKDAGLMLLRDIAFKGRGDLIDKVNIVFVPIFNADGHERSTPYSRPNQRGPQSMGWRNTGQNLNLNRDYMKADAPEMQAMLALINKYDPAFYIDLHVTDGLDYAYDVTYWFDGWDGRYADSPAIGQWLDRTYRPAADAALSAAGHIPGPMIFARDEADLTKGIDMSAFAPRFSHAYGDLRRLPTVLVENHSLKPYRQRVLGTYVLLEATLKTMAKEAASLKAAIAKDRASRPKTLDANWKAKAEPAPAISFRTLEVVRRTSAATGQQVTSWTGKPGPVVQAPVYVSEPGLKLSVPKAYWAPATKPDVIARLAAHGVKMEVLKAPKTVEVEMIRLGGFTQANPAEGRAMVTVQNLTREKRMETYPKGSVRISTDQPLGALVTMLLEPESEDSFLSWGFFSEILQRVEYMEPYAIAAMAERMLALDPKLKAEFEKKLADDKPFAGNSRARLQWFYDRSPFKDDRHLLYPVGREP